MLDITKVKFKMSTVLLLFCAYSADSNGLEFSYQFKDKETVNLNVPDELIWKPRFWKYDKAQGFKLKLYYPSLKPQIKRISPYISHPNSKAPQKVKDEYLRIEKLHRSMGDELLINIKPYSKRNSHANSFSCRVDKRFELIATINTLKKYARTKPGSGSRDIILVPDDMPKIDCITCVENANCRIYLFSDIDGVKAEVFYPESKTINNLKAVVIAVNNLLKSFL